MQEPHDGDVAQVALEAAYYELLDKYKDAKNWREECLRLRALVKDAYFEGYAAGDRHATARTYQATERWESSQACKNLVKTQKGDKDE